MIRNLIAFFWSLGYPRAPKRDTCIHCGRVIVLDKTGYWIDPVAGSTADDRENGDGIWRETCDSHDTFVAEHEPVSGNGAS